MAGNNMIKRPINQKVGALKRKFGVKGEVAPGTFINLSRAPKVAKKKAKKKVSNFKAGVKGLI